MGVPSNKWSVSSCIDRGGKRRRRKSVFFATKNNKELSWIKRVMRECPFCWSIRIVG